MGAPLRGCWEVGALASGPQSPRPQTHLQWAASVFTVRLGREGPEPHPAAQSHGGRGGQPEGQKGRGWACPQPFRARPAVWTRPGTAGQTWAPGGRGCVRTVRMALLLRCPEQLTCHGRGRLGLGVGGEFPVLGPQRLVLGGSWALSQRPAFIVGILAPQPGVGEPGVALWAGPVRAGGQGHRSKPAGTSGREWPDQARSPKSKDGPQLPGLPRSGCPTSAW